MIYKLEKIQRRGARWVLKDYNRYSSVTSMLHQLSWPELQTRRKISRLLTFYKILHCQLPISIPPYYLPMTRDTRQYHQHHFILPTVSTASYLNGFFLKTVKEWNLLPQFIIDINDFNFSHLNYLIIVLCINYVYVIFIFPEHISRTVCSVFIIIIIIVLK